MEGKIMKSAIVLALGFCLLGAGCVTNNVVTEVDREYQARYSYAERVGLWFLDRLNDAADVFQASVTTGFGGPLFNIHVTEVAQIGLGWFEGTRLGYEERAFGIWEEKRGEYGLGPMYYVNLERKAVAGTAFPLLVPPWLGFDFYPTNVFKHDYKYTGLDIVEKPVWKEDQHYSSVGFRFHLFLVGLSANLNVAELVDWFLGWNPVGLILTLCDYHQLPWDVMHDGTWFELKDELERERNLEEK